MGQAPYSQAGYQDVGEEEELNRRKKKNQKGAIP